MISTGDAQTMIVAFSGGADSVLAASEAVATGKPVVLWYLHHYASEPEPARTQIFRQILQAYPSVTLIKTQVDIARIAERLGYSWEHAASLLRRKRLVRFRAELEKKTGTTCMVITGHNYSDYLETLALRRERGIPEDALPSLSGRDEITGFLRPLYNLTRDEVRRKVTDLNLPYFDDPANEDESFARNRIRNNYPHTAMPAAQAQQYVDFKTLGEALRELHLPLTEWNNLSRSEKSRAVFQAFRRLMIVRRFSRNHFERAHRLPFNLPPFFAHAERNAGGDVVIFRRGLGASAAIPQIGDAGAVRGDKISRKTTIVMPYGSKSVAKIFSEKKLSPRERRRTLVFMKPGGSEASSIRFPESP